MLQIDRHLKSLNENTGNVSLVLTLHFAACSLAPSLDSLKSQLLTWSDSSVLRNKNNCIMLKFGRVIILFDCSVFQTVVCRIS